MGTVVTIPEAAIDYVLYGDKSHIVANYLLGQLENIPRVFNQFTQRIYDSVASSYSYATDSLTRYGILNQLSDQGLVAMDDYIQPIETFEGLQNANSVMQRWIMAHPETRQLYLDQNIDGYSDTYTNVFGDGVGENDYNYRRVMDGVLQDDGKHSYHRFYKEDLMDGDTALDHHDKVNILHTYAYIEASMISYPYDFTLKSEALVKINRD